MLVLKPSRIHGLGVFTTAVLRVGAKLPLFMPPDWVRRTKPPIAVARRWGQPAQGGGWWIPRNPNRMCIGWHLNHSDKPNVDGNSCAALRRIAAGEELLIDYRALHD